MKIAIVGAGMGGLATATLLLKKGHKVDIFEKEKVIGGRALSLNGNDLTINQYKQILNNFEMWLPFSEPKLEEIFEKKMLQGYYLDLGFHLFGFVAQSPILRVLKKNKSDLEVSASNLKYMHSDKTIINGLNSYLTNKEKIKVYSQLLRYLIISSLRKKTFKNMPISKAIDKYYSDKIGKGIGYTSMLITTINDLDKISSKETFDVLIKWIKEKRSCYYPIGGNKTFSNAFKEIIQSYQGKIHLQNKVEEIIIKNGIAKGIVIKGKRMEYDAIISNIPVQDLFKIASEKYFPANYVKQVKKLQGTGSLCVYYALKDIDSDLIGNTYGFVEKDVDVKGGIAAGIIDFKIADPKMKISSKNRYLVQGYIICSPEEAKNKKKLEMLKRILDNKFRLHVPDYEKKLIFALYPASWHLDGVAKIISNEKPKITTPVKNLYIVGDCVKSTGIGLNCAVDSAIRLAKMF